MAELIDLTQDIGSLVGSVEAFGSTTARADRVRLLVQIRDQLEKLRAADESAQAELWALHEKVSQDGANPEETLHADSAPREMESEAVKTLLSCVLSLQRYLTDTSPVDDGEAHQLLQEAVNTATGYVAGYQNLRDQLIRSEAQSGKAPRKVMRARPVKGEIDYAELIRDTIAKFPKILAALAK